MAAEMNPMQSQAAAGALLETPARWLSLVAAVVLGLVIGAAVLSVGVWLKEGRPAVDASFGGFGGGGRGGPPNGGPGVARPGQQPGGFAPQQGQTAPQGQTQTPNRGAVPQTGRGNGGATQGAGTQGAGAPPGLSQAPNLTGVVTSVSSGSLTVQTAQGARQLSLRSETKVFRADGSAGSLSDLASGERLAVVSNASGGSTSALEIAIVRSQR